MDFIHIEGHHFSSRGQGAGPVVEPGTLEDGVEVMCRGAGESSVTAAEVPLMRASRL